ncbi:MAG: thymidylate synthase ThyX [Flexilinea sp.]|nr:thymidylate synthase ThyX [Flexilinea sp.]
MNNWKIEILRCPTEEDWKRCLLLARATQGKFDAPKEPSVEWKRKILRAEHSPIRTLMFTIQMENIPYCNSVHFVRHKYGVEHYVQSQRRNADRGAERQDAPVTHIMDINAQELIFMARKRMCMKADRVTRDIMYAIKKEILEIDFDVWNSLLVPQCHMDENFCPEFKPCGVYHNL